MNPQNVVVVASVSVPKALCFNDHVANGVEHGYNVDDAIQQESSI